MSKNITTGELEKALGELAYSMGVSTKEFVEKSIRKKKKKKKKKGTVKNIFNNCSIVVKSCCDRKKKKCKEKNIFAKRVEIPKIINDEITLIGDIAELTYFPYEGVIIGDEVRVVIVDNFVRTTYLSVDYSINGKTITIIGDIASEFSGRKIKVSYLYVV